jgi:hypothetical protein
MDVAGSNCRPALTDSRRSLRKIVVIPSPMLAGYVTGSLGIRSAFVLSGGFLIMAAIVLVPLHLYRGARSS